jgi:dynein heavy chain
MLVSATSTAVPTGQGMQVNKNKQDAAAAERSIFSCPVYKYPKRNDKYLIFRANLKAEAPGAPQNPKMATAAQKWRLCNVALLCCKD